jgi:hypothetical protein
LIFPYILYFVTAVVSKLFGIDIWPEDSWVSKYQSSFKPEFSGIMVTFLTQSMKLVSFCIMISLRM